MVIKIILRVVALSIWFQAFIIAIAGIIITIQNNFNIITLLIFSIIVFLLVYLGKYLWKKTYKYSIPSRSNEEETVEQRTNNFDLANSMGMPTLSHVPSEVLNDMREYYSSVQIEGDIRILEESVELMKKTENIETFISRFELAQRTSLTLEQAILAGIAVNSSFLKFKELTKIKEQILPNLLMKSYKRMVKEANKLKTVNGKKGRYTKFLNLLEEYENYFDYLDVYEEIIDDLKKEMINFG